MKESEVEISPGYDMMGTLMVNAQTLAYFQICKLLGVVL